MTMQINEEEDRRESPVEVIIGPPAGDGRFFVADNCGLPRRVFSESGAPEIEPLTADQQQRLEDYEEVIRRGIRSAFDMGRALAGIQREHLYRGLGYGSFEAYCGRRWQISRQYAYRLIDAAYVMADLSPIGDKVPLPVSEAQVRPLTRLPTQVIRQLWTELAGETPNGRITAQAVAEKVAAFHLRHGEVPRPSPGAAPRPRLARQDLETWLRKVQRAVDALEDGDQPWALELLEQVRRPLAQSLRQAGTSFLIGEAPAAEYEI